MDSSSFHERRILSVLPGCVVLIVMNSRRFIDQI
jgi:hypothetical protein